MTSQNHVKRFEIKSHQRRDICLYPAKNGGPKTDSGGGRHHPPTLLGLKGFMLGQSTPFSYHTEANGYIFFATGVH